jgi:alkyl sulfatase BDS1-like metallo-beta-lactamase superfamily hydrolase
MPPTEKQGERTPPSQQQDLARYINITIEYCQAKGNQHFTVKCRESNLIKWKSPNQGRSIDTEFRLRSKDSQCIILINTIVQDCQPGTRNFYSKWPLSEYLGKLRKFQLFSL